MTGAGLIVLTSPFRDERRMARELMAPVEARDVYGLYAKTHGSTAAMSRQSIQKRYRRGLNPLRSRLS